ncbi:Uma2 family endonuclease [Dolichospermum sp. ST_con]|nr:Uma2 family endonuclease [Dolichospermum sp. ST_con]MDD1420072.1 Uma2 family endonuclease [Dolichospermum sp. ST_sed1]MDD1427144.1 Uma2 family endonuclease [Dolichospermum sp. ST_sed9]MDD1433515.1 Uma2 family endonuclease [Dolichospermum sp. ST_sed6]MDD1437371.1 Uma2 family endonuclease [Dolichospermum sp. ST_sed10]MDD1441850.1 Uma2 family endonuclease [Dolichospermum sp. ST_sed3]MDD1446623.1 Uma2 family endonuclease [Dolichospermum sp. ST_sed8]MDD1456570.1 Uma2 family endonuclease [Dolic
MLETVLAVPSIKLPPTQAELPCDDGIPMETQRHKLQMDILIDTIQPWLDQRADGYVGGNMFVYYSLAQLKNQDFRGPDFFAVLGVPKTERLSWVVWEEGKPPDVVIELLSESTANNDKNQKKLIYQNQMRVSEYFWYDPFNPNDFAGFDLNSGVYQQIALNDKNHLISKVLDLALVRWQGNYRGVDATWLRWATLDGDLFPTSGEMVGIAQQRAEQAELQLRQVAINLSQNGMSVEQVAQLTNLDILEVERLIN